MLLIVFILGKIAQNFLLYGFDYVLSELIWYALAGLAIYLFSGYVILRIGRKLGMDNDWQPYIPFARDSYKLTMMDESRWQILFFDGFNVVFGLVFTILGIYVARDQLLSLLSLGNWDSLTFADTGFTVFFVLMVVIYGIITLVVKIKYFSNLYREFGLPWGLAFLYLIKATWIVALFIAFDSKRVPVEKKIKQESAALPKVPAAAAKLTGVSGQYAGMTFDISDGKEVVLGKSSQYSNIVFDQFQVHVSRKHCSVRFDSVAKTYVVTNFSKNGVIYNNTQKMAQNETRSLSRGTIIALGTAENQFMLN